MQITNSINKIISKDDMREKNSDKALLDNVLPYAFVRPFDAGEAILSQGS